VYARQVTVKVYLYPGDYAVTALHTPGVLLATVGGILRTSSQTFAPSQVLDVYIIQINNVPAWWSVMPILSPAMQNVVTDIQTRNPGLFLRTHYVTRTGYGRDAFYQPSTNSVNHTPDSTPVSWVYFYPGYVEQNNGTPVTGEYYDSDSDQNSLFLDGNFMLDGASNTVITTQFNSDPNGINYSAADQFNNGMRYPDEMAEYAAVTAAAAAAAADGVTVNEGVTEISERMLFENMLSQPTSFANSIIINLHGELVPLPPIRNYSDAAKDPGDQLSLMSTPMTCRIAPYGNNPVGGNTNVRVVTHPELLYYPLNPASAISGAVTVRLRVYAYYDSENDNQVLPSASTDPRVPAISLFFPDDAVTLVNAIGEIGNGLAGGVPYARVTLTAAGSIAGDTSATGPMSFTTAYVGPGSKQTLFTLYNTPLRCPSGPASGGTAPLTFGGLNSADMLYGEEYIPCSPDITTSGAPVSNNTNLTSTTYDNNTYTFTNNDLANPSSNGTGQPVNTARWIISVVMPVSQVYSTGLTIFNQNSTLPVTIVGQHTIETRMGNAVTQSSFTVGAHTYSIPSNLSRTYVWTGATMPPYTEQYQFLGDPRDCPYFDVKVGGVTISGAAVTIGPNAYNWWFKNGGSTGTNNLYTAGYSGFGASGTQSYWNSGGGSGGAPAWDGQAYYNVNVDIPRYWQLIRQGLLSSTSIWTTTNGWSWYYYGMGGEIGFDQAPMAGGVSMNSAPFQTSTVGEVVNGYDSINEDGRTGASPAVGLWTAAAVTSTSKWYARPWLGEIYPDSSYNSSWVSYGNLPSCVNTTANIGQTFYNKTLENIPVGSTEQANEGYAGVTFYPKPGPYGGSSFFNGTNGANTLFYTIGPSTPDDGQEQSLSVTTYGIYQYALPYDVNIQRPWQFSTQNSGGSAITLNVPEWQFAPYNNTRTTLSIPSTLTDGADTTSRIFYADTSQTNYYGSALVQVNSGTTQTGYVVETGTAPSGTVGFQALAETDMVYSLRTFLDGGEMAAPGKVGHIVQVPLVKIYLASNVPQYLNASAITFEVGSPVTATAAGEGAVSIGMPVTDIWWRFPGSTATNANYYTEEYPYYSMGVTASNINQAATETGIYNETVPVVYNLKYSNNHGVNWYYVQNSAPATFGVCNYNSPYAITAAAPLTQEIWSINQTTEPQGDYWLMVEAYRKGYLNHYAYDIDDIEITW
jgi:hypothetical protein